MIFACKKESDYTKPPLINNIWILSGVQSTSSGQTIDFPSGAPKKIAILFLDSLNTIFFSGECNGGSGKFTIYPESDSITSSVGTTLVYCEYVEWESYTVEGLNNAYKFLIDGRDLNIFSTGQYNLKFKIDKSCNGLSCFKSDDNR
jgi:hypothetical protein